MSPRTAITVARGHQRFRAPVPQWRPGAPLRPGGPRQGWDAECPDSRGYQVCSQGFLPCRHGPGNAMRAWSAAVVMTRSRVSRRRPGRTARGPSASLPTGAMLDVWESSTAGDTVAAIEGTAASCPTGEPRAPAMASNPAPTRCASTTTCHLRCVASTRVARHRVRPAHPFTGPGLGAREEMECLPHRPQQRCPADLGVVESGVEPPTHQGNADQLPRRSSAQNCRSGWHTGLPPRRRRAWGWAQSLLERTTPFEVSLTRWAGDRPRALMGGPC